MSMCFMCANYSYTASFIFVQLTRGSNTEFEQQRNCPSTNLRTTRALSLPEMVTHGFKSAEIRVSGRVQTSSETSGFEQVSISLSPSKARRCLR